MRRHEHVPCSRIVSLGIVALLEIERALSRGFWERSNLVRRWVIAKADVAVYAEDNVLGRKFRNSGVDLADAFADALHKGLPVLERPTILAVVS